MKNFIIGIFLSLLPINSFFSWIYVFSENPRSNQSVKLKEFNKYLFDISINETTLSIINIILSFTAIYFLINFQNINNIVFKIFSAVVIIVLFLVTIYNIWGLL